MATTPTTKRKATSTAAAQGLDRQTADVAADLDAQLKAFKLTWSRERIVGMVIGVIVASTSGLMAAQLMNAVMVATMAVTASAFLATLVYVIGCVLLGYASGVLGGVVYEYIACGAAREHVVLAGSKVRSWFGAARSVFA